ncbi:MAG: radical SAM protein [Treponema sp.]|nr:radical SAM protein [Treponema sp.]
MESPGQNNHAGFISKIQGYSTKDGPGIRSTVFCAGCNLRCLWCANPELIESKEQTLYYKDTTETIGQTITPQELVQKLVRDKVFYDQSGGGVTFSGGEPALQSEFTAETAALLKKENIRIALDTAGNVPWEMLQTAAENADLILYDIKAFDEEIHRRCTGVSNSLILKNAERLASMNKSICIRLILVPAYNDGDDFKNRLDFVQSLGKAICQVDILPMHRLGAGKYKALGIPDPMEGAKDCPKEITGEAVAEAERRGFTVTVGG